MSKAEIQLLQLIVPIGSHILRIIRKVIQSVENIKLMVWKEKFREKKFSSI